MQIPCASSRILALTASHFFSHGRDVKLDNLLIDENRNIKIVDFGFSVSFKEGQKLRKACGSPSYAAPEIVSRRPYSPTGVDVWSLGVVLYAMVCGYFPFQGSSNQVRRV